MTNVEDNHDLQHLGRMCLSGGIAEAELELHAWCRRADAPAGARLLLASLLARRGAAADAIAVLRHDQFNTDSDPDLIRLTISVLIQTEMLDTARKLLRMLHDARGHDPVVKKWIAAVGLSGRAMPATSHAGIEHLAAELIGSLHVIPSLVAAAVHNPKSAEVEMLRAAIHRTAADAADDRQMVMTCQAMAQLAMLAHDADDARRWAHRGLKLDPYHATLAIILSQIGDDLAVGPSATDVLRRVVAAHPDYADVRLSLIRREQRDGRVESARIKLAQWLEHDPANPHALDLVRELAA